MNYAATILRDVSAAGGMIAVRNGQLRLSASKPLPQALIERVREAKPVLLATLQLDTTFWKAQYQRLITFYASQGNTHYESEWKAMNETFLECCRERDVLPESDAGYSIMRTLITAIGFNPVPAY